MITMTEWICIRCGNEVAKDREECSSCGAHRDPLHGKILARKYRLLKRLAEGGMGYVYLAEHVRLKLQNKRAIKILKEEISSNPQYQKRFLREAEVTHILSQSNAHIVTVYDDYGFEDGLGYYVMEYLEGTSLQQYIKQHPGDLPLSWVINILLQICNALHAIHNADTIHSDLRGIIHRDLKPLNIFVVQNELGQDSVKLIDFGVAKVPTMGTQYTKQGMIIGTLEYLAPEQINTSMLKQLDARCDIYALGCVAFELLTGQLSIVAPSELDNISAIKYMMQRISEDPPPPSSKRAEIPPILDRITLKMLAYLPESRYQTIADVMADLCIADSEICREPKALVERNKLHIGSIPQKESSIEGNVQPVTDAPRSSEFSDHSAIKQAIPHDQKSTEIISQIKQNQKDSSSQISDSLCALDPPPSLLRTQLGKILILLIVLVVGIGGWFVYSTFQTLSPNVPIAPLVREPRMITGISDDIAVRRSAAIARHKPSEAAIAKEIELSGKTPERPEQAIKERTSNMPVQEHQAVIEKESKRVVRSEGKSKPARRIEKKAHITQAKRSVRGCPADIAGFHWVRLNVQPVGVNFTGKILTGKVNRLNNAPTLSVMRDYAGKIWTDSGNISNSICVSIQRGIQIQLTNNQYKTCIIEIPARAGTLQIKMEKEDRYGINIRPANYCLQNK